MIFGEPVSFSEAMGLLAEKGLMPTNLSSAELRRLDADLRARSIFSARTTVAAPLQRAKDLLGELLDGTTNIATARMHMQDLYDSLGYEPEIGFGDDATIPPAERGSLRDLSSDRRVDLVLTTNMRQMANQAYREAGQTDFALYAWPCYELLRIYPRQVPRGERVGPGGELVDDPGESWPERWEQCGGNFYDGRMIARKDDPIWEQLGSSTKFDDAMDTDVPPFAFNSGFGWRELPREECVALGVIDAGTEIEGRKSERAAAMEVAADFDPEFLKELKADLDVAVANGRASLKASSSKMGKAARELAPVDNFDWMVTPEELR